MSMPNDDNSQEISGMPTSLKREPSHSQPTTSPDAMGEPSSSGATRGDKADSSQVL